jgi:hypothetical protein
MAMPMIVWMEEGLGFERALTNAERVLMEAAQFVTQQK